APGSDARPPVAGPADRARRVVAAPGGGGVREPVDPPGRRTRLPRPRPVRGPGGGGDGHRGRRARHGHRAGAAPPPRRPRPPGPVAAVRVRGPPDARRQPGIDRRRLRRLRPRPRRALPDLRREPGAAAGPARPRARRARRPRPRGDGRRRAAAPAGLVGGPGRAGRPGVRRLVGVGLPPHSRPGPRRPRAVPGRRWPPRGRLRGPAVRAGRPRAHRRGAAPLRGGRRRRRGRADRTGRARSRGGQSPPPV
ncbi:MAG: hypothetical protein AVDCRST_MAG66-4183, partial [uncultured Pseudonocardia sp.]